MKEEKISRLLYFIAFSSMSNQWFQFKQFKIVQKQSAMKVGTDGVLLGAWANITNSLRILDVGTGTGLLALMLAQRAPNASIEAIEINAGSYREACENVSRSPWKNRITIQHVSFQDFVNRFQKEKYDLVVSNPPYYEHSHTLISKSRKMARHLDTLSLKDLMTGVRRVITETGHFCAILPVAQAKECIDLGKLLKLNCQKILKVKPTPQKDSIRWLIEFGIEEKPVEISSLIIEEDGRHNYSQSYKELTREFYLNF